MGAKKVFRGTEIRDSLFWLSLALFFGGVPLIVYFTEPDAGVANLIAALLLGVSLFGLSIFYLGRAQAVVLDPPKRELVFVEGLLHRRKVEAFPYDAVTEIATYMPEGGGGTVLELRLRGGRALKLSQISIDEARRQLMLLREELGVEAVDNGKRLAALPSTARR